MNGTSIFKRIAVGTALAGGLASGLAFTGAGVASASTADPALHAQAQSEYKADCSWTADVQWDRASNTLRGTAYVDNHLVFAACRKNLVVVFVDDEGTPIERSVAIDTAAATLDPTAPHTINQPIEITRAVPRGVAQYVDHITVNLVPRNK